MQSDGNSDPGSDDELNHPGDEVEDDVARGGGLCSTSDEKLEKKVAGIEEKGNRDVYLYLNAIYI